MNSMVRKRCSEGCWSGPVFPTSLIARLPGAPWPLDAASRVVPAAYLTAPSALLALAEGNQVHSPRAWAEPSSYRAGGGMESLLSRVGRGLLNPSVRAGESASPRRRALVVCAHLRPGRDKRRTRYFMQPISGLHVA